MASAANVSLQFTKWVVGSAEEAENLLRRLADFADGVNLDMKFAVVVVAGRLLTNEDLKEILAAGVNPL